VVKKPTPMPSSFGCGRAFSPLQHREQGSKVAKRTPIGVQFQKLHAGDEGNESG
jgi:hypothetical protein